MNILPREKQIEAVAALCEGVSIRATERLSGVNRGTIMALGARVGMGCAKAHNKLRRDRGQSENTLRLRADNRRISGKITGGISGEEQAAVIGEIARQSAEIPAFTGVFECRYFFFEFAQLPPAKPDFPPASSGRVFPCGSGRLPGVRFRRSREIPARATYRRSGPSGGASCSVRAW